MSINSEEVQFSKRVTISHKGRRATARETNTSTRPGGDVVRSGKGDRPHENQLGVSNSGVSDFRRNGKRGIGAAVDHRMAPALPRGRRAKRSASGWISTADSMAGQLLGDIVVAGMARDAAGRGQTSYTPSYPSERSKS